MADSCSQCVMDSSSGDLKLDAYGVCHFCRTFAQRFGEVTNGGPFFAESELHKQIDKIKSAQRNKPYDCIVGLSGGIDSSYVALLAKDLGLRVLCFHFDSGWNSEVSVRNIQKTLDHIKSEYRCHVCDWHEMRDLQTAFFRSGVMNCDIPQDHAFMAALFRAAKDFETPFVISGHNLSSEYVMPMSWGYTSHDLKHIHDISRRFGSRRLKRFPTYRLHRFLQSQLPLGGIRFIRPLNFFPYHRSVIKDKLTRELGWIDYGKKHGESMFTSFFQEVYLPEKFGIIKLKAHLSSEILSGVISRQNAQEVLASSPLDPLERKRKVRYICSKLGIAIEELERILSKPGVPHSAYAYSPWLSRLRAYKNVGIRGVITGDVA